MRNVSDRSCGENQNAFYVLFLENLALYEIIWKKYFTVGYATDDNMAHVPFMLDN